MARLNDDPAYAAKRASEMHETALRMDRIASDPDMPASLRERAFGLMARAISLSLEMDRFVR